MSQPYAIQHNTLSYNTVLRVSFRMNHHQALLIVGKHSIVHQNKVHRTLNSTTSTAVSYRYMKYEVTKYKTPHYDIFNPLNAELNPIRYLLALLAYHFLHVSRVRVKSLTLRLLMSYIYMERLFLMFLDHTQRRSTVGRTPLDE